MALDPPFVAHMSADEQLYKDAELGIKIVYVLKYTVDEYEGMRLVSAGAVFHQLLDASGHSYMLHILSGLMSPKLAEFGAFFLPRLELLYALHQALHHPVTLHRSETMVCLCTMWEALDQFHANGVACCT